jgi:hypothetical protein
MGITKINNLFYLEELDIINKLINETQIPLNNDGEYVNYYDNDGSGVCKDLGRIQIGNILIPDHMRDRLVDIANKISKTNLMLSTFSYAEYSAKYGAPDLPAHFDYDKNDLVFDIQLESNTSWDLGINLKTYSLENNSALIFNANENVHWRPHKKFKDGEYVKMIFARFCNLTNPSDYSNLNYAQNDPIFDEVIKFRNSL